MATIIPSDLDPARTYVLTHEHGEWEAIEVTLGASPSFGSRTWVAFVDRRRDSDPPREGPAV